MMGLQGPRSQGTGDNVRDEPPAQKKRNQTANPRAGAWKDAPNPGLTSSPGPAPEAGFVLTHTLERAVMVQVHGSLLPL